MKKDTVKLKNCPKCGKELYTTERVDNLPEVVLYKSPKLVSIFKRCFNCKWFFFKFFKKEDKER